MSSTTTLTSNSQKAPITGTSSVLNRTKLTECKPKDRFQIPWPESKEAERQWQLEQMAAAFRIFAKLGYADGGSGHISVRGMFVIDTTASGFEVTIHRSDSHEYLLD
jgi:hypothetical protein